jgi:hypothetical protein
VNLSTLSSHLESNRWIGYHDRNGPGYASPDAYIVGKKVTILFEVKLTGGPGGKLQMEGLYKPLLEALYSRPVVCLLVCRWVTEMTPGPFFDTPQDFLASKEPFGAWNFIPRGR